MADKADRSLKKDVNKGAWTADEDRKLSRCVEIHGEKRWRSISAKAGLNRSGKSCRLRWLNYLRPNIKRGSFSDQEEDLMIRLHKLLGNRWSLIARRLPGRTDNEVKNYWNTHLTKKINNRCKEPSGSSSQTPNPNKSSALEEKIKVIGKGPSSKSEDSRSEFNVDDFFDFSKPETTTTLPCPYEEEHTVGLDDVVLKQGPLNFEWVTELLELDQGL